MRGFSAALFALAMVPGALFADSKAVSVRIDTPSNNSRITTATIAAAGIVSAPSPNVRVEVNGIGAEIDFTHAGTKSDPYRWVANLAPAPGRVKIKVRAFIPDGATPNDEGPANVRHVDFAPSPASLDVGVTPASGLVPLDATFSVTVDTLGPITRFRADFDGNGTHEIDAASIPQPLAYRYTVSGTYTARFSVTLATGETRNGSATVVVNSLASLDTAFREIWTGFSNAMKAGDVAAAVTFFDARGQLDYGPVLQTIQPTLPQFAASLELEGPVWITNRAAHYLITQIRDGTTFGYHLYFSRMSDGSWKIVKL